MDYCVKCGSIYLLRVQQGKKYNLTCNECGFEGNASKFEWLARLKFMLGRGGWITRLPTVTINLGTAKDLEIRNWSGGLKIVRTK